ncbi:hypothetical protein DOTSEDRAFT_23491 [Dothistroma septosporum NZE10]|uniref:REM-1 domain-containing protein n=1 Tax=Dothistroma septosporum (strain NZE10 / CBS 128990) TaxID=675120 RepID=N1PSS4_DOTSN|nr:hypothetical protein DOTSEDRAFT_23491 [Dothistroma septosporum NZE10]
MPRKALRVQGASRSTAWTLRAEKQESDSDSSEPLPAYSPRQEGSMQANGHYFEHPQSPPVYESYDGSGYGSPGSSARSSARYSHTDAVPHNTKLRPGFLDESRTSSEASSLPYVTPAPLTAHDDGFDFGPSLQAQDQARSPPTNIDDYKFPLPHTESHQISLNTRLHDHSHDAVGQHLLYENALLDTQTFQILDIDGVDELKKEQARLNQRIEAANRKLTLEIKVKDAARNLQRLYSSGKKDGRPDTPQSPDSPRKHRSSMLGNRNRTASNGAVTFHQAEDEVTESIRKVDELHEQIRSLLERRQIVERSLLRHTAAVLAAQASRPPAQRTDALTNVHRGFDEEELHLPGPDEFDGIRDILRGKPAPASKQALEEMQAENEQQIRSMHSRLEQLNTQLRSIIEESSQTRGQSTAPEPPRSVVDDPKERLTGIFDILERSMQTLDIEQQETKAHYARMQDSASQFGNAVEEQLEALNSQLYATLQISAQTGHVKAFRQLPQATGRGYEHQLERLQEGLLAIEQLLQQHNQELKTAQEASRGMEEAQTLADAHSMKVTEYDTVLAGLWDMVAADAPFSDLKARGSGDHSSSTPPKEDFSIHAFNSRVQHMCSVASSAREQQDILRRQIQQQRDLNGKADVDKEIEIADMQSKYDQLESAHDATQQELANLMIRHQDAEKQSTQNRDELINVMNELEQMRHTVEQTHSRQKEIELRHAQMSAVSAQLSTEKDAAEHRHSDLQKEMETQESELVRLMTELTVARAELEAAHGSRSERKKEAGVAAGEIEALQKLKDQEIEDLRKAHEQRVEMMRREHTERSKLLESELEDMTNEFQEMTRESLELEKEREKLESLIDSLRERCDELEAQLGDEKMKWMGIKSPGGADPGAPRESTSVMVLRQEFKKMMREARSEGVRLLRTEQEERRKLEAEMRRIRQAQGPMSRSTATNATPSLSVNNAPTHNHTSSTTTGDVLVAPVPSTLSPSIAAQKPPTAATPSTNTGG